MGIDDRHGICGALTILFALFALRPALAVPGRGQALGAWLLAASLMGLDNLSDAFFRLDCQAANRGCTSAAAMSSWHGKIHVAVAAVSGVATIAGVFALAFRMRRADGWRDLARPTFIFGLLFVAVLIGYAALEKTGGGYIQRAAIVLLSVGVVTLALRVRALVTVARRRLRIGDRPAWADPERSCPTVDATLIAFSAELSGRLNESGGSRTHAVVTERWPDTRAPEREAVMRRLFTALVMVALVFAGGSAYAAQNASISVSPSAVAPGGAVQITGSIPTKLCPASDSAIPVATADLFPPDGFGPEAARNSEGAFAISYTVPTSTPAGTYQIGVRCGGGLVGVTAALKVTAVPVGAPATGAGGTAHDPSRRWIVFGCVALAGALLAVRRRLSRPLA